MTITGLAYYSLLQRLTLEVPFSFGLVRITLEVFGWVENNYLLIHFLKHYSRLYRVTKTTSLIFKLQLPRNSAHHIPC